MPAETLQVRPIRDVWLALRRVRRAALLAALLVVTPWIVICGAVGLVLRVI